MKYRSYEIFGFEVLKFGNFWVYVSAVRLTDTPYDVKDYEVGQTN